MPISDLCVFQNRGVIDTVVWVDSPSELRQVLKAYPQCYVIGKGSNTVINPDTAISCFVRLSNQFQASTNETDPLLIDASASVPQLLKRCQDAEMTGLEFCAGVPATVGGMIAMNFGCWGQSMADRVKRVQVMTREGEIMWLTPEECRFSYRNSIFLESRAVILAVLFDTVSATAQEVKRLAHHNIPRRLDSQPLRAKTFGSVFKNPTGHFAGQLIESVGFKGQTIGPIRISEMHANFFENIGEATFSDLMTVIEKIKASVYQQHNIQLELEVQLIS